MHIAQQLCVGAGRGSEGVVASWVRECSVSRGGGDHGGQGVSQGVGGQVGGLAMGVVRRGVGEGKWKKSVKRPMCPSRSVHGALLHLPVYREFVHGAVGD